MKESKQAASCSGSKDLFQARFYRVFLPMCMGLALALIMVGTAAGAGVIMQVSTDSAGVGGNRFSENPSISADGRYVAFDSAADNLVPGDTNGNYDVFLKDTSTGAVSLVSTDASGSQGDDSSYMPSISADGRYVAFTTYARNLYWGINPGPAGAVLKDTATGSITPIYCEACEIYASQYSLNQLSVSANGRYVAFDYYGCVPAGYDEIGMPIYNCWGGIEVVDSQTQHPPVFINGEIPSISGDGRYVAFVSDADNLVPGDTNGVPDIFKMDTTTGSVTRISTDMAGNQNTLGTSFPSISADGRYVAFMQAIPYPPPNCYDCTDIFMKDTLTGVKQWVSSSFFGGGGFLSRNGPPSISADGRVVAFASTSKDLVVDDDTNGVPDVFAKDTRTGEITRLSTDSAGVLGNNVSDAPSISANGAFVAFQSNASNLVPGDTNARTDIFLAALPPCSSDCKPFLTLSKVNTYWDSYPAYQARILSVDYGIYNWGADPVYAVQAVGSASSNGVTCSTAMPVSLGTIENGGNHLLKLTYAIPQGVAAFHTVVFATAQDVHGGSYSYPGPFPAA